VQSSSAELQSAANQQASGAKSLDGHERDYTTISELLATSRANRRECAALAHVAEETSSAARSGDTTVQKSHESVNSIKRQVDLIVTHMLDLGRNPSRLAESWKSSTNCGADQHSGDQRTIEASGAGDAGKRFAVVATKSANWPTEWVAQQGNPSTH